MCVYVHKKMCVRVYVCMCACMYVCVWYVRVRVKKMRTKCENTCVRMAFECACACACACACIVYVCV